MDPARSLRPCLGPLPLQLVVSLCESIDGARAPTSIPDAFAAARSPAARARALRALLFERPLTIDLVALRRLGLAMVALAFVLPLQPLKTLVPCPLRTLTGVPCPLCGMTTSVIATLHLHFGAALAANPVGLLAVPIAIALVLLRPWVVRVPIWLLALVAGASWIFELHRFGVLG